MLAKDVMTRDVITVGPDTPVAEIAKTLLERHISAVPVVDASGGLLGIVSEGDLLRRPENETDRTPASWWLRLVASGQELAQGYLKSHGTQARHVMTKDVHTVGPDTPLDEIVTLLERRRIKRVPVTDHGKVVGIVSRANLLHGLASGRAAAAPRPSDDDRALRERILGRLREEAWWTSGVTTNLVVHSGVVELWGWVATEEERAALKLLVETTPGVKKVDSYLATRAALEGRGYM